MKLNGGVAVVTGAASGIGRALAMRFAGEGMQVAMADIEEPALEQAATALRNSGATVMAQRCDVSSASEVEALADAVYSRYGSVNLLCNNAGVGGGAAPIWKHTLDSWQWVLGVNLMGVLHGIRSFVPRMLAGGQAGHVVNTASVAGLVSGPLLSPYYATKHAVAAISECLYFDLKMVQAPIGVSVLCPGFVRTGIGRSERNRPTVGDFGPAIWSEMGEKMRELIAQGMAPEELAERVVEAVESGQFWILTHPEMDFRISDRSERILARRNPEHLETQPKEIGE